MTEAITRFLRSVLFDSSDSVFPSGDDRGLRLGLRHAAGSAHGQARDERDPPGDSSRVCEEQWCHPVLSQGRHR